MKPFPEKYQQAQAEADWRARWAAMSAFKWKPDAPAQSDYVIDTPPPTVSGTPGRKIYELISDCSSTSPPIAAEIESCLHGARRYWRTDPTAARRIATKAPPVSSPAINALPKSDNNSSNTAASLDCRSPQSTVGRRTKVPTVSIPL